MKNLRLILITILLGTGLAACSKKSGNKETIALRPGDRGAAAPTTNMPQPGATAPGVQNKQWSAVLRQGMSQENFQAQTEYLLSANVDIFASPKRVGAVSGDNGQSTGIRLAAYIPTQAPVQRNGSNSTTVVPQGSELLMVIWDSYSGQKDSTGAPIYGFDFALSGSAAGTVSGNRVDVTFTDSYGKIRLTGDIFGEDFYGEVIYDNNKYFDGYTPGARSTLGFFYAKTCAIFKCQ